ncbi:MAG: DUF2341 domain-containing protein [Kiritimatiellae bacterium]|nr:DUF2341 domain-containing protein [Kiritimatiellia bacterium]
MSFKSLCIGRDALRRVHIGRAALVAAAICVATAPSPSFAESRSVNLVCGGYTGTAPLQNFQALVKLSAVNDYGFDYDACAAQDGSDLWFTDASGNVIPHEVDTWTHGGDSFVWVKIPEVVDASTKITLHYGDLSAKETTTDGVWTGFAGVWHMNGTVVDGTAQNEPDATGHGLDAVPRAIYTKSGTTHLDQMTTTPGKVGTGRVNQTEVANYVQGLAVPDYSSHVTDPSKFTISGWWSATALKTYPRFASAEYNVNGSNIANLWTISGNSSDGYAKLREILSNGTKYEGKWAIGNFESPKWVYLTVVWNEKTLQVYSNGTQTGSDTTIQAQTAISTGFTIGAAGNAATQNPGWVGYYDEVRMADGALTAERIAADYKTMNEPTTFLTLAPDVDAALWTGAAGDGDAATAGNWTCYDAAGNTLSGDKLPVETTKMLSCSLSANADWTTLGFAPLIPDGSTIDLNGHNLNVSGFNGAGTVTNSVDATLSTLTLVSDSAVENATTAIGGNVKLVKDGAGTFTSSKTLTYTGGTQVDAGTIQAPKSTAAYNAAFTPFGTGKITINPNGTFNAQSTVAYTNGVILAGGTITGGAGSGQSIVMLERVTADSIIIQTVSAITIGASGCPIDLGGNKISVSIAKDKYFRWYGSLENTTGTIVTGGISTATPGYFEEFPERARGVDLDLYSRVNFAHAVYVHDYRAANGNYSSGHGTGHGLYVSGTYTPVGNYYHGCVMEDGSTLDLSGRTGYFTVKSGIDNTNAFGDTTTEEKARKTVQFASGTVTVNLAGRTDLKTIAERADNYIVKWSTDSGMGEPSGTTFKLDAATAKYFKLKKDATGLQLRKIRGLVIVVK